MQDVVILNKVDLISSEDPEGTLEDLEKEIHKINSLANIIRTVHCQVDLSKILACHAYDATVSYMCLILRSSPNPLFAEINGTGLTVLRFLLQHATHLEALLEENNSLSTGDLHDASVRTICISDLHAISLEKVLLFSSHHWCMFGKMFCCLLHCSKEFA